jgi:hypothetical protein
METAAPKPELKLNRLPDGRVEVSVGTNFTMLGETLPEELAAMAMAGQLLPSVTAPRRKLAIARWHLTHLQQCLYNEAAALLFLEGFVTELRASTFALQFLLCRVEGFDTWYELQRELMRKDPLLRWLVDARNQAQKQGLSFAEWGFHTIVKFHRDGKVEASNVEPVMRVNGIEQAVSLKDLEHVIQRLSAVVEQAHSLYLPSIPNRQLTGMFEYIRERDDGSWEHFDVGSTAPPHA